ncbi:rab-GTPase-TBC domain-containing protein [Gorgonomyces haynaldii]|nr:rab-GTPase-TBC domain-containing protein [Gorgonomyces haynaldii]
MANKLEDLGWNVLERFSRVTNIAKDTTTKVLHTEFARPFLPLIPTQVRSVFLSSSEVEALLQDYDSAEHYLARFANEIQARMSRPKTGIRELDTTRDYEQLKQHRIAHFTGQSVMREQFQSWFDADGTLTKSKEEIYSLVFCGGIEPGLRTELYKYILGYYPFESTGFEREQIAIDKQKQYRELLASWQDILSEYVVGRLKERKYRIDKDVVRTDRNVAYFEARENAGSPPPIETYPHLLELRHILMTYTMLDFETGYVQGMSDLASPLLTCLPEEAEAFWCFNGFMQRMKPNFLRDQSGMRTQLRQLELLIKLVDYPLYELMEQTDATNLFCCFRWLLILFKREFEFEEIKFLWEIIWTCPLTKHFHLFIALAILNQQRQELMQCQAFDEVLKTVNDLSGKISPVESVQRAQVLFYCFRDYFLHYGPQDLVTNLPINQLNQHDQLLAQTSGVNTNLDMVLDKLDVKLTNDEWNELAMLFESNL